jgi:TRAP-type transport system periplasmic protein
MKNYCKGFFVFMIAVDLVFAAGITDTAKAAEKYTLRVSMVIGADDPLYKGYSSFAENVQKRTNGGIKVTLYPNAQLGQDEDIMEQALLGADMAFNTDAARLGVRVKEMGIILAPYLFDNPKEANKFLSSSLFKSWQKNLADNHNLTLLSLNNYVGGRNFITKVPIKTPADLKGLRIRTAGAPVWQETIRSLGATPVSLPWMETYTAFQQGVVDGAEAQHPATFSTKLYEIGKYITLTNHILLMNGLVVGTKWFKKLPADYQKILLEEAVKAGDVTTKMVLDSEKEYEKKMAATGVKIQPVNVAPFKVQAESAYVKLGFIELRKEINKILGKK